ncbi:MAG: flippase [Flavobacteriales bacterium]|jgi:O-antigen/teichoic acid export membrane protein|nr:flippase [Flavobacteriales bacterium]MBT6169806.1 flippase [Flavobacteriaceae bacterium]
MKKILNAMQDKDFSEIFKKGGWSFLIRIGGQVMGFLLTLLIANYFGAKGLGDYVLSIVVLRIFTLFSKLGMDTFSIRFIASFAKKEKWKSIQIFRNKITRLLSITSLIFSLLMYCFSQDIANLIHANVHHIRLNAFFVLPMAFFMLHYQSLRGLKKIIEFSFFYRMSQATFSIISIFIITQFILDGDVPVYAYLSSLAIVSLLAFISFSYNFNKLKIINSNEQIENLEYRDILKVSIPLMFAQSVQFIMAWTDKLMLGNMRSPEEVGIYFTAFKLSMFASIALMAVNSIAAPIFAELYGKKDMNGLRKVAHQSSKIIFLTTLPLVLCFLIFPDFLLSLFGPEFAEKGVIAFMLLSFGKLISTLSGSVGNILQMTGKQVVFMNILFVGAIVNGVLNLFLIPKFGINGAAFASMISLSLWNLIMVYFVKREFGFYTFYVPFSKR